MLKQVDDFPTDYPIAGIHCVPFLADGNIVMGWHPGRKLLETLGGRIEPGESMTESLHREAVEEGGVVLSDLLSPFAAHFWGSTQTYTVFVVSRVNGLREIPKGFETTGRVITDVKTAQEIIRRVEPDGEWRVRLLDWAVEAMRRLEPDAS